MSIGSDIRDRREAVEMTQIKLGNLVGHGTGSHICRIEKDKADPRISLLNRIWRELERAEQEQAERQRREAKTKDKSAA